MKKINIIRKNDDFKKVIDTGKLIKNNNYIIYYKDKEKEYYRFGISVGKKISKRAVDRNKLKRQIKNIIDNNKNVYQKSKDYIIILKKSCLEETYSNLEKSFINIMKQI